MACPHCGSWSVKADRGLAGRLVCGSCARPLGMGLGPRRRRTRPQRPQVSWMSWRMGLAVLVAAAAILAAWDQQRLRFSACGPQGLHDGHVVLGWIQDVNAGCGQRRSGSRSTP
jgi:hypothetical protein